MPELGQNEPKLTTESGFEELRNASYLGRDRASLFLTAKGVRPASILELWIPVGQIEEVQNGYKEDIRSCKGLLEKLGLPYTEEHEIDEDDDIYITCERHIFNVGKDEAHLQKLLEASNSVGTPDPAAFCRNLGRALGYPETAVEANAKRNSLKPVDYPKEIRENPAWPFCIFALSKDHWREEMEFVGEQAEFIKKEDPRLYDAIANN